jgi:hypothetical protein
METVSEILRNHGIHEPFGHNGRRFRTTCPQCSNKRTTAAHKNAKVLGVTIEHDHIEWGCDHCGWKSGESYKPNGHKPNGDNIYYVYQEEGGAAVSRKVRGFRDGTKIFWWQHPDGNGGWTKGAGGAPKVLYRLPELTEDIALGHPIVIPEGEKDVDTLRAIGVPATCNPDGAPKPGQKPKWRPEFSEELRGADIVVIPDHDDQGYAHAEAIASMSAGVAKSVRVLKLAEHWPECPKGGDVSDWIAKGHTREELDALLEQAPQYVKPLPSPGNGWQFHDEEPSPLTHWLVKNLLPETGAGLMSGQWGTFKTTTALDLAVSVMAGSSFADRFLIKRRGGVAYFAVEGSGGLKSRLNTIAQERHITGALPFAWRADCPSLTATDALAQLVRMAKEVEQELKQRFNLPLVLIYIDTMIAAAGYASAGDDNDTAVAQKVMSVLSGLSQQTGALVLGVDHFGKDVNVGTRGN